MISSTRFETYCFLAGLFLGATATLVICACMFLNFKAPTEIRYDSEAQFQDLIQREKRLFDKEAELMERESKLRAQESNKWTRFDFSSNEPIEVVESFYIPSL